MSIAIRAEHLSKEYRLGTINHGMLFRDIQSWMARKAGKPDPHEKIGAAHYEDLPDRFWALKDVSFDIEQGDRVGVIGRNGAGKSTLLKILSRITAPTEGRVKIKGRVVSLLEVGTGFHPELTGRENIYLNGAILGMKKRQVAKKMDEIIAFSEIEKFIDTPVKRYSSGMYVRLAFAVAAHLDSDILLADEVLAVGDVTFQRKCIGKMGDISNHDGRTILYVSHNLPSVSLLCNQFVVLDGGRKVLETSSSKSAFDRYNCSIVSTFASKAIGTTMMNSAFAPVDFYFRDAEGNRVSRIQNDDDVSLIVEFNCENPSPLLTFGCSVFNDDNVRIFDSYATDVVEAEWCLPVKGYNKYAVRFPSHFLNEGEYRIELIASIHRQHWILEPAKNAPAIALIVSGGLSDSPYYLGRRDTICAPILKWSKE